MVYFERNLFCVRVSNHMSRLNVPSRPSAISKTWPRVSALALVGVALASCSDSGRFGYTNNSSRQAPPQEVTGSVTPRSAPSTRVVAQPLPAPSAPAPVAINQGYSSGNGSSSGAQGPGPYRPAAPTYASPSTVPTASVPPIAPPTPPCPTVMCGKME